jgi:hypothetical protein
MKMMMILASAVLVLLAAFGFILPTQMANAANAANAALSSTAPSSETADAGLIEVGRREGRHHFRGGGHFRRHKFEGRRHSGYKRHFHHKYRSRRHYYRSSPYFSFYFGPSYYDDYYYNDYQDHYDYPASNYYGSSCAQWQQECANNWGYKTNDYYGCLKYHRC